MGVDGIFLIRGGQLTVLQQRPYDSEARLQEALALYPDVLAGSSTVDGEALPLFLVKREMGVPKAEGAGATWSLDHLFLDGQGVPVVVEIKRSSDTRIRREVLGQMLDYAANAVRYWPIPELRAAFEATAQAAGTTGDERLRDAAPGLDPEAFWKRVEDNLRAGRIRMVFVADHLPAELVRIIEFLNEQMSPAEVLGVEVPQYVGAGDEQVLVPNVVGRTSVAVAAKQSGGAQWDAEGFLAVARERQGDDQAAFFQRLFDHVDRHGGRFSWGRGVSPGVSGWYAIGGSEMAVWTANAGGATANARSYVYLYLPELRRRLDDAVLDRFVSALAEIEPYRPKIEQARAEGFVSKYPSVFVSDLVARPEDEARLFAAFDALLAATWA